jgi:hypothetical protein
VLLMVRALVVLRVPLQHATFVGLFATLLPASSATRLWPTGSLNNAAVVLALLGLLATLAALDVGGVRRIVLHVTGALLYAASIATYEVAAVAILVFFLAYLRHATVKAAVLRSACDTVLVSALGRPERRPHARGPRSSRARGTVEDFPAQLRDGVSVWSTH